MRVCVCVRERVHAFTSGYISYALVVKSTERTRPSSSKTVLYSLMQVDLLLSLFVSALFVLIVNFRLQFKRFNSESLLYFIYFPFLNWSTYKSRNQIELKQEF